jgi:hypothetical protein
VKVVEFVEPGGEVEDGAPVPARERRIDGHSDLLRPQGISEARCVEHRRDADPYQDLRRTTERPAAGEVERLEEWVSIELVECCGGKNAS